MFRRRLSSRYDTQAKATDPMFEFWRQRFCRVHFYLTGPSALLSGASTINGFDRGSDTDLGEPALKLSAIREL
jgi:hypothetical protein